MGARRQIRTWLGVGLAVAGLVACSSSTPASTPPGPSSSASSAVPSTGGSVPSSGTTSVTATNRGDLARKLVTDTADGTRVVHRVIVEGRFAIVHSESSAGDVALHRAVVDVLEIADDGTVSARSTVQQRVTSPSASGRTMFDGGGDTTATADLEANRAIVLRVYTEVFKGAKVEVVDELFAADYAQHNPLVPDGSAGVKALAANGLAVEVRELVAQGDLVAGWVNYGTVAAVDIFRIKDGKIVEHWDVLNFNP